MTHAADDLIPEAYYTWPREIQSRYLEELHALYFPGQQAATAAPAPHRDDDTTSAKIIPLPASRTRNPRNPTSPDGTSPDGRAS